MYKVEFYKDNNGNGFREEKTRFVNDDKMRVNLYNIQKRGWMIKQVTYVINIHEFKSVNQESDNKQFLDLVKSYPEGFLFQVYSEDVNNKKYKRVEVYPPNTGFEGYIFN